VTDGALVAELQSVLGATADESVEILPGSSETSAKAESTPLPAPQIGNSTSEAAPAAEAPASEKPAAEVPAAEAPASETSVSTATATEAPAETAAPDNSDLQSAATAAVDVPIQGDRTIFLIQKNLEAMGYHPGPADGQVGPRTTAAIQSYQRNAGLMVDGVPSEALLEYMIRSTR